MSHFDCIKCGKKHGMVLHDNIKNTDEPLDMCYDCILSGIKYNPIPVLPEGIQCWIKYLESLQEINIKKLSIIRKELVTKVEDDNF
jgi:hypothetical protein